MATKIICDKCATEIQNDSEFSTVINIYYYQLSRFKKIKSLNKTSFFDLCNHCSQTFNKFLTNFLNDIKINKSKQSNKKAYQKDILQIKPTDILRGK